tara:strand:+ start:366 stop:1694 length:1329 start_codon:yes stop_codon:yes gene_type:complete
MKNLYIITLSLTILVASSCEKLEQEPPKLQSASSLTEYSSVLNAAYYYQLGAVTPMAVMGDFRADNAYMDEAPYTEFDVFGPNLISMEDQFFGPFYTALYKSILSANNVIENSKSPNEVGEARFLRALSYFKLVQVFGDVSVNLEPIPNPSDKSILPRQAASSVYNNVIIPDLQAAIGVLSPQIEDGRASKLAAQGLLGKVYMHLGDFFNAELQLAEVVNNAAAAGVSLQGNFADIFGESNDLNSEILFATQINSSINDEYGFSDFWVWYAGLDTKSLTPIDPNEGPTIIAAFDASPGDLRRDITIDTASLASPKFPQTGGPDHDWIELRLADVILLYAEALNENGATPAVSLAQLDAIRLRAGLNPLDPNVIDTQAKVREAIYAERRLELAFEGHRWFDLVRTGTVDAAMGQTVNPNYYLFPIPVSEVLASFNVITQNPGY